MAALLQARLLLGHLTPGHGGPHQPPAPGVQLKLVLRLDELPPSPLALPQRHGLVVLAKSHIVKVHL